MLLYTGDTRYEMAFRVARWHDGTEKCVSRVASLHAEQLKKWMDAGGMAGLGSHGEVQGLGTHWELWMMAAGGLDAHAALRMATLDSADAIGLAVKRLRQRPAGDRVLILLTDGANNVGEVAPVKAAELASQDDIRIYTIGVGADEMRLPSLLGGVFGARVVNPSAELDEDTLTDIAATTGGRYFRAQNTAKLVEIYDIIDQMEPIEQEAETYRPIAVLYYWPMGLAWALFMFLMLCDWRGWGGD